MNLQMISTQVNKIVDDVARFIAREHYVVTEKDIECKDLNSLVSYVDKEAERALMEAFSQLIPESGFITEESGEHHPNQAYRWIIDPLDGTSNFLHGIPIFSVSVALQYHEKTIFGVVHEVNKNEQFYAIEGVGAFMNGEPIRVLSHPNLSRSLVATGFPYQRFDTVESYLSVLSEFMQTSIGVRRMGSAAVDLAYTACGRFGGFFEANLNSWDVSAGAFIVEQAGGVVTDFNGGSDYLFGRQIVAGNPSISSIMLNVIQKYPLF